MKKITFLVASILLLGGVANASEMKKIDDEKRKKLNLNEPISFVERDVAFYVFADGTFDFNTQGGTSGGYYYKETGRRSVEADRNRPVNQGVVIEQDAFGRVRRVGNTFINYDAFDRVSRIGTVFIKYRNDFLTQVGGLQLVYDRRGNLVDIIGTVKGRGFNGNGGYVNSVPRGGDYYYKKDDNSDKK
jgi:hypothetical protein